MKPIKTYIELVTNSFNNVLFRLDSGLIGVNIVEYYPRHVVKRRYESMSSNSIRVENLISERTIGAFNHVVELGYWVFLVAFDGVLKPTSCYVTHCAVDEIKVVR